LSVDATGTGLDYEIYEATRPDRTSDFGTPTRIAALSSSSNDWTPSISSDGLELYFQTNRGVNYDIYVSRRASTTDAWPTPARLEPLSGDTYSETDPTISYDGTSLGFGMFQGPGGLGNADIYYASRSCLDP
jgi:Tol biopolymer transport system component